MPTARRTSNTEAADASSAGGLTPEELELYERLRARVELAPDGAGTVTRPVTEEERVLARLLKDRHHLDGCPAIDAIDVAIARTEAYGDTRPPRPKEGLGPVPVVVVRCLECGGTSYHENYRRPDDLVLATLEARRAVPAAADLDVTL